MTSSALVTLAASLTFMAVALLAADLAVLCVPLYVLIVCVSQPKITRHRRSGT